MSPSPAVFLPWYGHLGPRRPPEWATWDSPMAGAQCCAWNRRMHLKMPSGSRQEPGIPTSVVVFGPTDPDVWGPRGENVHTVRKSWCEPEIFELAPKDLPGQPDTEVVKKIRELL